VWSDDNGRARRKFQDFERYWLDNRDLKSFGWIKELELVLKTNGYRLVLVLTPVNSDLLKEYARLVEPGAVEKRLEFAHEALLGYLRENQIAFIDIYGYLASEEYADLFHLNSSGDRRMAELITIRLSENGILR
jgi:lysophospholipase L1-like esterase